VLILLNCSNSSNLNLESNQTVKSVFNKSEIKDLSRILKFFNEQICSIQRVDQVNPSECYRSFFERMKKTSDEGFINIEIPYKEQQILYTQIRESTFEEIWSIGKSWIPHTTDTTKSIYYNHEGKFVAFLKELGNENKMIKNYYDAYESCGDICPSIVADLIMNYENYDIKDVRVQLVVAIHYLTLNDQTERNEKY
jgi:hypothetical protein